MLSGSDGLEPAMALEENHAHSTHGSALLTTLLLAAAYL